ncbi:MAG TPA: hypothetical protein VML75_24925 [Kofleriaceae bacterium]|nr:hypothetical protein [Kofleriaceae bacterium]
MGLYPGTADPGVTHDRMVDEIADLGATHVALVVSWEQEHVRSNAIRRTARTSVSDAVVARAAARARARGLKVLLFPILTVRQARPGEWRGTLVPADRSAWWRSYERFILHYAGLAATIRAEVLLVGSELGSTESWRDHWYHLIGKARAVFPGGIAYSANWDHYRHVSFWRRLDYLGVTGYFELTRDNDASQATLTRSWARARDEILAFMKTVDGPRLWLSEVGYVSRDGAATRPWDYGLDTRLDLEEQRRCYQALREAWSGVPALDGVFMWNWFGTGGPRDGGYTPRGKPAEQVLRRWWN